MNHRFLMIIHPGRLYNIISILRETGCIDLSKVRIFGMVGSRFSNIVRTGPEKLSTDVVIDLGGGHAKLVGVHILGDFFDERIELLMLC